MEQFDQSAVGRAQDMRAKVKASTMVQESKARQRNAWGGGSTVSGHFFFLNICVPRSEHAWWCRCLHKGSMVPCALGR